MESVETRLRLEKNDLIEKLKKAREFRGTETWGNLTVAEKCLLDTQIRIMESYIEVLINRIILLKSRELEELNNKENKKDEKFNKIITEFIDKMDAFFEEEGEE